MDVVRLLWSDLSWERRLESKIVAREVDVGEQIVIANEDCVAVVVKRRL
jgi:hypothetical protein